MTMKHNRRNYYRILHVQMDAPTEIIKASYRTCMQKLREATLPDLPMAHGCYRGARGDSNLITHRHRRLILRLNFINGKQNKTRYN